MDKIYVIVGTTGECSDREEWPVMAYATEEEAINRVKCMVEVLKKHGVYSASGDYFDSQKIREVRDILQKDPGFDMHIQIDYTGTDYSYYAVPFHAAQPKEK